MVPDSSFSYDDYVTLPGRFNPVKFDAKAWVRLAKAAGQQYIVFTTKHHDGFAMFDATNTDYKITKTPFGRDVFAELAQAAREEGMPLGIYYSPPDMHHPGYRDMTRPAHEHPFGQPERTEWENYLDYMEAQLRQLLTRYGDIAIVWFDGLEGQEKFHGERFHKLIHELQPKALINDRIGVPGDFATPEQRIPKSPNEIAGMWEACMTINDTWAYNKNDRHYKSARDLIWNLADIASKNGNFLLDVGPTPLGTIQPEFRDRLLRIGTLASFQRRGYLRCCRRSDPGSSRFTQHRKGASSLPLPGGNSKEWTSDHKVVIHLSSPRSFHSGQWQETSADANTLRIGDQSATELRILTNPGNRAQSERGFHLAPAHSLTPGRHARAAV